VALRAAWSPLPPLPVDQGELRLGRGSCSSHRHRARQADFDHSPGHRAHFGRSARGRAERGAAQTARVASTKAARAPSGGQLAPVGRPQVPSRMAKDVAAAVPSVTIQRSASCGLLRPGASSATRPAPVAARRCCSALAKA
jgi:hypothetical protein